MEQGKRYILCARCGLTWNISRHHRQVGDYICPECRAKEQKERRNHNEENN